MYSSRSTARLKDGHTGLAERPKVAGAQAVAAGSNNEDAWQIDRGQKNATARAGAEFGKGGRQQIAFTGASRRRRMLTGLFRQ
jgi:hypothetical protein